MLVVYVKIYKVHAGSNFYGRSSGAVQSEDWYCNQGRWRSHAASLDSSPLNSGLFQRLGIEAIMQPAVTKINHLDIIYIGSDTEFNMLARFLRSIPSRSRCWRASSSDSVKQDQLGIKGAQFSQFLLYNNTVK